MAQKLSVKILSPQEIEFLKEKIQILLSDKGIKVEHPEVCAILAKAGAQVEGDHVKFPKAVYEKALGQVPREFLLAGIDPKHDMQYPHPQGLFYVRTNTGGMNYLDENGGYGHITLEQVAEWTRLANAMENVDFVSLPSTNPIGFPSEAIDVHTYDTVLRNTTKHAWLQPYEADNVNYLIEMAQAVAGGAEAMKKRPIASLICCSVPFLTYKYMDANIILKGAQAGVPLQPCSLPAAGANAPITPAGVAVVACAEVMAMIIMAQMIAPGTPCVATPLLFELDMATTNTTQSAMNTTMGRMVSMQLFSDGYGIPVHTYATGTDACFSDTQSGIEQATLAEMVALSGASVLGAAGQVETAKTLNPQQLIIDNEVFGMVKQLKAGLVVNEENIGWEDLMTIKEGESFVTKDHTFAHFKDGYRTKLFSKDSRTTWLEKGAKTLEERAKDAYQVIKANYQPVNLPENVQKELDAIVKRADVELKVSK